MLVRNVYQGKRAAASFQLTAGLTLAELEAETVALVRHERELLARGDCPRSSCDGKPHHGFPHPHDAKISLPRSPVEQAKALISDFADRPHLEYLSERIRLAVEDVEAGVGRRMIVELPPRTGKTFMTTQAATAWIMGRHPEWPIVLSSYSSELATSWSREIRRWVEAGLLGDHVGVAPDSGRAEGWETTRGGKLTARSLGGGTTGFGAKVLVIDDPHKDFAEAHSLTQRNLVWNWWLGVGSARLHRPALVIVVLTRWHEDDFAGRLLSSEYPGDPEEWEVIRLPAIAEESDILGREPGEALLSPLVDETPEEAVAQWKKVRQDVGSYTWAALYQQRPSPPEGTIVNADWWRFWTTDPELASRLPDGSLDPDGQTILANPERWGAGQWVDSWDTSFKGGERSDYAVGQRWVKYEGSRFLTHQWRGRWDFTEALEVMKASTAKSDPVKSPYGEHVRVRVIEDSANGPAIISTLRKTVDGIVPYTVRDSKEGRARAVSPEIERGEVRLPHPSQSGFGWVTEFLSEWREFPNGKNDDQVDATTQALIHLKDEEKPVGGKLVSPPRRGTPSQSLNAALMGRR